MNTTTNQKSNRMSAHHYDDCAVWNDLIRDQSCCTYGTSIKRVNLEFIQAYLKYGKLHYLCRNGNSGDILSAAGRL